MKKEKKTALIIVDVQNDFCEGGALEVKHGSEVVALINKRRKLKKYHLVVATLDFHPKNHQSFASNNGKKVGEIYELSGEPQVMWPDHCVQGTPGAELHSALDKNFDATFKKGLNPLIDSYSGFFDNDKKTSSGLEKYLRDNGIEKVEVTGLALDYCVKATALDAASLGFETTVILPATRAVNLSKGDDHKAIAEMMQEGIFMLNEIDEDILSKDEERLLSEAFEAMKKSLVNNVFSIYQLNEKDEVINIWTFIKYPFEKRHWFRTNLGHWSERLLAKKDLVPRSRFKEMNAFDQAWLSQKQLADHSNGLSIYLSKNEKSLKGEKK